MLKWYLRIYIFIEYLKCVGKVIVFGLFEMILKKKTKSEDCIPRSRSGRDWQLEMSHSHTHYHSHSLTHALNSQFITLFKIKSCHSIIYMVNKKLNKITFFNI